MLFSNYMVLCSILMIFCGLWSFCLYRKHLLNMLLSLEFIMLGIFWMMSMGICFMGGEVYFVLFFLTLAACEGALGLSLLVSVVRTHGDDCFNSFSILEC
uniref:NADH-ubiquinone oxidoreductase chain 4L n=1 Tax=Upogebia affinis TaxID=177247 RepID=A0A4Y5QJK4_9EUCA|nr:NADH dehydrogenase subunit 4L [Upogebia affinis]